jgi:thioesterase domain-containing protein
VVGASLGALLAFALAGRLDAAGRTPPAALVLVNPLPPAPWAAALPRRSLDGDVRPWQSQGRFDSTMRALPGAAFSDRQFAYRGWRDESTALLREAQAGPDLPTPRTPRLVIASDADADVPPAVSAAFAMGSGADLLRVPGGHVEPVMGGSAAHAARLALAWLDATLSRP